MQSRRLGIPPKHTYPPRPTLRVIRKPSIFYTECMYYTMRLFHTSPMYNPITHSLLVHPFHERLVWIAEVSRPAAVDSARPVCFTSR